jgi:uncharacterized protein YPO0396
MTEKRNPIKQIMSQVHKDARAGKLDLNDHGGFVGEVKRRLRAAGLQEDDMPELKAKRRPHEQEK